MLYGLRTRGLEGAGTVGVFVRVIRTPFLIIIVEGLIESLLTDYPQML